MTEIKNTTKYDLEPRTLGFTKEVRLFINKIIKTINNFESVKQLVRSSGSVGANYIEANEALSKKDFIMRIKICRKEAKETIYWLCLLEINDSELNNIRENLMQEANELKKIFSKIIENSTKPKNSTVVS